MNYTIFGESHGPAIGVTLTGVPAGLELDWAAIEKDMARRAPGKSPLATARKEADQVQVLSGVFEGKTTGSPLCAMIANTDTRSADYSKTRDLARPGHADYPAHVRYQGFNDYRGGGHFSGRLTAPLVFAGAIAKQILAQRGITVGAHISSIYGVNDEALEDWDTLKGVADKDFPVLNDEKGQEMQEAILEAKEEQDSVGGSIECGVFGLPAGYGSPDFGENAEGIFSQYLFAVPAVKAVAFGAGTAFSLMRGSEANDPLYVDEHGNVGAEQNCAGGINGGITNGMPLVFEVTMRPTPSIARTQFTIDMNRMEHAELELQGRHDPCVVPRAVPVIEAAAALAACQLLGI
ncbi:MULTISPECIES: chorismate synthase [Pseudoflavonifractor]|uniref:chorismate synthase n=1 Tax=Pseudoflavonifractor TaxID=1017280 RepID=UPI000B371676|nr:MULTISPECIES: chorismate synthase [Pseudoflavonifractor]MBM6694559.1 chorismate synthase [Pseudoflavonifractor capillosus]OUP42063.1 chorismate synthase [Pseudoflavonifractor sp. An187]OUP62735.1 chorismate synthase [Pseudoflavonifractor sp. An176]